MGKVGEEGVEVPEDEEDEEDQGNKTMAMQMAEKLLKSVSHARPLTHLQGELLKYVSCQIQNTMDLVGVLIREGQPPPQPGSKGRQGKRSAAELSALAKVEELQRTPAHRDAVKRLRLKLEKERTGKGLQRHESPGAASGTKKAKLAKPAKKKEEEEEEEEAKEKGEVAKRASDAAAEAQKANPENPELFQSAALKLKKFRFNLEEACLFSGPDYLTREELNQLAIKANVRIAPKSSFRQQRESLRDVDWSATLCPT